MLAYVHAFLLGWVFTLFVETVVFIALVRRAFKITNEEISLLRLIAGGIFASTITIPFVWFVFPVLFYDVRLFALALGETFAFVVEALFYIFAFKLSARQAVIISLFANAASFLLGQVLLAHG